METNNIMTYQFIARQPIFDRKRDLFAYELLYRAGDKKNYNVESELDGDQASTDVLTNAITVIGIKNITDRKRAFINFTYNLLKNEELLLNLPSSDIVVEILEGVVLDKEILGLIKRLKSKGYVVALDDYEDSRYEYYKELFKYVDIIKVDFMLNSSQEIANIPKRFPNKILLAEKVETNEVFEFAKKLGYKLFQGFFFSKPQILKEKDIPINSFINTKILKEINRRNSDLKRIAMLIETDVALTYKLLKLINSPFYRRSKEIDSIVQAVTLLGVDEIKKWLYLSSLSKFKFEGANEVIKNSLVRAKFCEKLQNDIIGTNQYKKSEFFLTGMLSMMEVILQAPMEKILKELPLSLNIKRALIHNDNELYSALDIFIHYELGKWSDIVSKFSDVYNLENIQDYYLDSINWAESLMGLI